MKQVCKELWIENRGQVWLFVKLIILVCLVFGSTLIPAFPYSFLGVLICLFYESVTMMKMTGEISFLIPQTEQERKNKEIWKAFLVGSMYSAANTVGYILLVCQNEKYHWDTGLVLFFCYMTVVVFLVVFKHRISMCQLYFQSSGQQLRTDETWRRNVKIKAADTLLGTLFAEFACLFFIIAVFGRISFLENLIAGNRLLEGTVACLTLADLILSAVLDLRAMGIREYCRK